MEAKVFRYSTQLEIDGEWHWFLETNEISEAKHHLRCRIGKNPKLTGRVVDKQTDEIVFIDPDPDAIKIRYRTDEGDEWHNLEITYIDEEGEWLHLRDGSDVGVWLTLDKVHPDVIATVKEYGKNLERRKFSEDEVKMWGELYTFIHQRAEYLRQQELETKE